MVQASLTNDAGTRSKKLSRASFSKTTSSVSRSQHAEIAIRVLRGFRIHRDSCRTHSSASGGGLWCPNNFCKFLHCMSLPGSSTDDNSTRPSRMLPYQPMPLAAILSTTTCSLPSSASCHGTLLAWFMAASGQPCSSSPSPPSRS